MKIRVNNINKEYFPNELLEPSFNLNKVENPLFNEVDEKIYGIIENLNNINFLIGANNSGKSRFLRGLMKFDENFIQIYKEKHFSDIIEEIINHELLTTNKINNNKEIVDSIINPEIENFKNKPISYFQDNDIKTLSNIIEKLKSTPQLHLEFSLSDLIKKIKNLSNSIVYSKKNRFKNKEFIPILRSLFKCKNLHNDTYSDIIEEIYNLKNNTDIQINSGLELYDNVFQLHNSKKIDHLEKFAEFLRVNFFENKAVKILPDRENHKLLSINIDNKGYRGINEIGDGIQQIIMLMFPLFNAQKNSWIFIEEPETNLHPGFQRIFINTLLKDEYILNKNLKFFITTHSNHFLDLSIDKNNISIFQFEKHEEGKHLIKNNVKPSKQVLDLLGVKSSSVFLANCSLWVEGPTDRKYLSYLLKLYANHINKPYLKEDIDFAFFEYGGNLIAHYLFDENIEIDDKTIRDKINSFSLSNKIFLLTDNDNAEETSAKGIRRKALKTLSDGNENFFYQNTELKEIENLLPQKVIKEFINKLIKNKENTSKLKNIDFNRDDYINIGLGQFYEELFVKNKIAKNIHRTFKAESGTLKNTYKIKLCDFVVNSDYNYLDLIEENLILDKIVKSLYTFIKS